MLSCFGRGCKKSPTPSPSPTRPNLPNEMIRTIAGFANARTVRSMSRATGRVPQTRRQMPIGLASGRVGTPIVTVRRPPVIVRSRATAKTPRITRVVRGYVNTIDKTAPQAYKNNQWKYYAKLHRNSIVFMNTRNGVPFLIDKQGRRKNVNQAYFTRLGVRPNWRNLFVAKRRKEHTWDAYQKRLQIFRNLPKGGLDRAMNNIDEKVDRYVQGNRTALQNVPFSRLVFWSSITPWMTSNGPPYVKRKGYWTRINSNHVIDKWNVLNNILMHHPNTR